MNLIKGISHFTDYGIMGIVNVEEANEWIYVVQNFQGFLDTQNILKRNTAVTVNTEAYTDFQTAGTTSSRDARQSFLFANEYLSRKELLFLDQWYELLWWFAYEFTDHGKQQYVNKEKREKNSHKWY